MEYLGFLGGIAGVFMLACLSPGSVWVVITFTSVAVSRTGWVYPAVVILLGLVSAGWHCGLAMVFSVPSIQGWYRRAKAKIDSAVGALLIALGLRLAFSR